MCLSTMHSLILMLLLMFTFDNVDGDEPRQRARLVNTKKFRRSLRSDEEPARFFMPGKRGQPGLCQDRSCPYDCGPDCRCNDHNNCVDYGK
uniref:Conopeptide n=1 Tax=Conus lenavati TaxID=1519839 RepID=A0A0K8TU62_CONLV